MSDLLRLLTGATLLVAAFNFYLEGGLWTLLGAGCAGAFAALAVNPR